jgi:radical SAM protein with 4Fe4S-binding SPASM domain
MYFKLRGCVILRNYPSFGYITDNRNFGYSQANHTGYDIGDKIVSQSGTIFLSVLSTRAQSIDCLAKKISVQYPNVNIVEIQNDATEFYILLEQDGFITSGTTRQECNEKDTGFTYINAVVKSTSDCCSSQHNEKKSTQEFLNDYFANEPQLTNLHVEITSKCNERCVHCYIPHENKDHEIDPDMFYSILKQSRKMNLLHLTLSGGEPLLHKNIIDFLRKCNESNLSVNILSNLTLLNKSILDEMKKNRRLSVQVSLYSMDPSIHDAITQVKGSCEKTKQAILKLWENNIPMQISCPIMRQNINSYKDVLDWGKEHNISVSSDYVIIARYNHTTGNLNNRLFIKDVKELIKQKIDNDTQYLEQIELETQRRKAVKLDDPICSVCHSSLCITENGDVYPCAGWQDYVVGNVNHASLSDIWLGSERIKHLRDLCKRDFPQCIRCPDYEYCTMCLVRNANENPFGDPLAVNSYFCDIAKIHKEFAAIQKSNLKCPQSTC